MDDPTVGSGRVRDEVGTGKALADEPREQLR